MTIQWNDKPILSQGEKGELRIEKAYCLDGKYYDLCVKAEKGSLTLSNYGVEQVALEMLAIVKAGFAEIQAKKITGTEDLSKLQFVHQPDSSDLKKSTLSVFAAGTKDRLYLLSWKREAALKADQLFRRLFPTVHIEQPSS